jgi:plasmid stabilization system protein ParE
VAEVRIGEEAEAEYTEALAWYAERSARAADRFEAAFASVIEQIGQSPERFPECDEEGYRFAALSRYPYSVIYQIAEGVALVVAVAHASRRPGFWTGRI